MPAKICDVTALSCINAGVERGSEAGNPALARKRESGRDGGLRADLGAELIENGAPFDMHRRDRRRSEFVGEQGTLACRKQQERCQRRRNEPEKRAADSLRSQPPAKHVR